MRDPNAESDEIELVKARREWKARFLARVRVLEKLLASAVVDDVPTPRGEGDDA